MEYLELPGGEEGADHSGMCRKAYAYIVIEQDLPVVFTDDTVPEEVSLFPGKDRIHRCAGVYG
ncbi:MAG: hypothetical protein ACLTLQ_05045 [[Clostridium] scindens]